MQIFWYTAYFRITGKRICMDWRSVKFDWNRARAFLVTAEEGSLSAAAKALDLTQPTLGRQVAALEQELGVALFERVGKGLELTPTGLDLVEHVRAMGDAASRLSLTASGQSEQVEGDICISATEMMAAYLLPPVIEKLWLLEPGIRIELIGSNQTSDLKRREADIAIRAYRPTQDDLIIRHLMLLEGYFYASPRYLDRLGRPKSIEELQVLDFVGFDRNTDRFRELLAEQDVHISENNFSVFCENSLVHWELTKQGVGIGVTQKEIGDAEPLVERVLPKKVVFSGEYWLVVHRELHMSRRVRRVFDFLVSELSIGTSSAQ